MAATSDGENDGDKGEFSLGAVVRLTGLSDHTIRAWERRYDAVRPARSPKGTRRYSRAEIERLQLLRAAVEAGHRIGDIARLSDREIEQRLEALPSPERRPLDEIREALERLDLSEVERWLGLQLAVLGTGAFCEEIALPLLREAGDRWERGEGSVASEHLLTSATRGLLGTALRSVPRVAGAPRLVFTTPQGERHELGALVAAVTAAGQGASVTYLGPDLPVDEVVSACHRLRADAVGLSVVTLPPEAARRYLEQLRESLAPETAVWVGGANAPDAEPDSGVQRLALEDLGRAVARLIRRSMLDASRETSSPRDGRGRP
jgi:DNA-binding transcriptional MerR regulator/methylmalonyl-CoA mutase cobalamin-binding subunit